jgi:hypothetical protein
MHNDLAQPRATETPQPGPAGPCADHDQTDPDASHRVYAVATQAGFHSASGRSPRVPFPAANCPRRLEHPGAYGVASDRASRRSPRLSIEPANEAADDWSCSRGRSVDNCGPRKLESARPVWRATAGQRSKLDDRRSRRRRGPSTAVRLPGEHSRPCVRRGWRRSIPFAEPRARAIGQGEQGRQEALADFLCRRPAALTAGFHSIPKLNSGPSWPLWAAERRESTDAFTPSATHDYPRTVVPLRRSRDPRPHVGEAQMGAGQQFDGGSQASQVGSRPCRTMLPRPSLLRAPHCVGGCATRSLPR